MESQLWHEDACNQNGDEQANFEDACSRMVVSPNCGMTVLEGDEQEHFEDACSIMVVSHTCGMKMLEGDEQEHFADPSLIKTLQIQLKTLQSKLNKVNASRLLAAVAAHHWQEACRADKAKSNQVTKENQFLTDEHEKVGHWLSSSASADVPFH